jgi:PilZ domain
MATFSASLLCAVPSCGHARCVSLAGHELCRAHFISKCYGKLQECSEQLHKNEHWKLASGESLIDTLTEITDQSAGMGLAARDLDGLEQAQVLDILNTAGTLMQNLRRSTRKCVSIGVRLQYEVTGHNWVEDAKTTEVSSHGASIECRIPIAKGEMMTVERLDNSRRTLAKVKWHRRRANGTQVLGVELVDAKNFWGLGKT